MRRTIMWVLAVVVATVAVVTGGTWAYIELVRDDPPNRLTVDSGDRAPGTSADAGGAEQGSGAAAVDGVWRVTSGSQAGYRVKEVLFGQDAEAVGRTDRVNGQFEVRGISVTAGSFTVDMATVTSDETRRDNQFRGRIMDVARHPTATFRLAEPIRLPSVTPEGQETIVRAVGDLTLRGTTKRVSLDLQAKRSGTTIQVAGRVPIVFEEWGILNPSFGPARTEDRGELEFRLGFERAT